MPFRRGATRQPTVRPRFSKDLWLPLVLVVPVPDLPLSSSGHWRDRHRNEYHDITINPLIIAKLPMLAKHDLSLFVIFVALDIQMLSIFEP